MMGLVRLARARTDRDHRAPGAATVPRNPSVDEIQEPLATPDRGLFDEELRVRGRIGTADASLRTAALRRRILGAMGRGDLVARKLEERPSPHRGLPAGPCARPACGNNHGGHRTCIKGIPRRVEGEAKARTLEKNLRPNRKSGSCYVRD